MSRPMKSSSQERRKALLRFKLFIGKVQRGLTLLTLFSSSRVPYLSVRELEALDQKAVMTQDDVKKGHFAVFAVEGGEPKRFLIELEHLANPAFLRLLELAKEEYGFSQEGALVVPCRPEELRRILKDRKQKRGWGVGVL